MYRQKTCAKKGAQTKIDFQDFFKKANVKLESDASVLMLADRLAFAKFGSSCSGDDRIEVKKRIYDAVAYGDKSFEEITELLNRSQTVAQFSRLIKEAVMQSFEPGRKTSSLPFSTSERRILKTVFGLSANEIETLRIGKADDELRTKMAKKLDQLLFHSRSDSLAEELDFINVRWGIEENSLPTSFEKLAINFTYTEEEAKIRAEGVYTIQARLRVALVALEAAHNKMLAAK
ncbi:MAG: hypothetical protein V1492_01655 [Candidatus Micrarchaeota archaeon]